MWSLRRSMCWLITCTCQTFQIHFGLFEILLRVDDILNCLIERVLNLGCWACQDDLFFNCHAHYGVNEVLLMMEKVPKENSFLMMLQFIMKGQILSLSWWRNILIAREPHLPAFELALSIEIWMTLLNREELIIHLEFMPRIIACQLPIVIYLINITLLVRLLVILFQLWRENVGLCVRLT